MIRLNVKKDGKVEVKSFVNKKDLDNYVLDYVGTDENYKNFSDVSNTIWNLNVGTAITVRGLTIAMAGKSRAGDIMLGGK